MTGELLLLFLGLTLWLGLVTYACFDIYKMLGRLIDILEKRL